MMRRMLYIISLILVAGMMILIFRFSASYADESSALSSGISRQVISEVNHIFHCGWSEKKQNYLAEVIETPIRKCAHFSEYALLAFLLKFHLLALMRYKNINLPGNKIAWIVSVIYAATDEFHQYFVPGRACRLFDVGVDSLGALSGILVFLLISHIYLSVRKSRR